MPSFTLPGGARSRGRRPILAAVALLATIAVVASCSSTDTRTPEPVTPAAPAARADAVARPAAVSAPFDLGGVIKQVHFAYRPEGAGFSGGHRTYAVAVSGQGLAFTPAAAEGSGAAARFVTTSIGRGDDVHAPAPFAARVRQDGHLAIARGEATEHLRNDEDGVEQSFTFAERPAGHGDLVVRQRVTGEDYAGVTAGGHHFLDPASGLGVRYGAATLVDARGARTPLEVRWTGEELAVVVPEAVVEGAAYPVEIDPSVSAEIGIDTSIALPDLLDQVAPAVGWDGTNWLVVWTDGRQAAAGRYLILGTRVTTGGAILDTGGIPIGVIYGQSTSKPVLAFDGTNFLVVWDGYDSSTGITGIFGTRVAQTGVVLNASPFLLAGSTANCTQPAIAFNGLEYLVVFTRNAADIYHVRVSMTGAVLNGNGTLISNATGNQSAPAVVWDGAGYFVVWQDHRGGFSYDIYGARVTNTGVTLDTVGIQISTAANDQLTPRVDYDGQNYLVVWNDGRWGNPDIYAARVSPAGMLLDAAGIGITPNTTGAQTAPSLAFDGTNHVVVWGDTRFNNPDIYAARVSPAGTILDTIGYVITAGAGPVAEQNPAVACTAAGACFAAWEDQRGGTWDIYGARFSGTTITDLQGIRTSIAANDEAKPSIAFDGTNYLVVWQDLRGVTSSDIYGARVSAAGVVLDTSGIAISTGTGDQITPTVTYMAPNFLVVWEDKRTDLGDIYGARVSSAGALLDAAGLAINTVANEQQVPFVSSDGTNFFVVWNSNGLAYGTRVTPAGAPLDGVGIKLFTSAISSGPGVAFDGTRYLAVVTAGALRGNRVTPAGALLDGTNGFSIGTGSAPRVAFDGLNFLVVFEKSSGVFGARVTGAAAVLDPTGLPISPYVSGQTRDQPSVGCDGQTCLVAWRDFRSMAHYDVYGAFVDQSGTILNASGLAISTTLANDHAFPAVARDLSGHALVAYQRLDLYQPYGNDRVHARLVTSLGQGTVCAAATDCASGFCVDGVCCNTACNGGSATDCFACSAALGASADGNCTALSAVACDDGNACTQNDKCQAGACVGGTTVTCTAMDACHTAGTCSTMTGMCSNPAKPDGTTCSDGSACTQTDTCMAGVCTGKNPVTCPMPGQCTTVAACDPTSGTCPVSNKADGTACSDGDACTQGDVCAAGACAAGTPVVCPAPDQCHTAGACDPTTGVCSNPAKPDGAGCDDGDACTTMDSCMAGVCTGKNPVTCPSGDQCNDPGTCDPATGTCSGGPKADGTHCVDSNGCTVGDTCQGGVCTGGPPLACTPIDACHEAGTCTEALGTCTTPNKPDDTPCPGGTCQGGKCKTGGTSSSSSSSSSGSSSSGSGTGGAGGGGTGSEASSSGTGGGTPSVKSGCSVNGAGEEDPPAGAPLAALAVALLARRRRARRAA
jgi:uncharacterized protein (TIGR03382 family)